MLDVPENYNITWITQYLIKDRNYSEAKKKYDGIKIFNVNGYFSDISSAQRVKYVPEQAFFEKSTDSPQFLEVTKKKNAFFINVTHICANFQRKTYRMQLES